MSSQTMKKPNGEVAMRRVMEQPNQHEIPGYGPVDSVNRLVSLS